MLRPANRRVGLDRIVVIQTENILILNRFLPKFVIPLLSTYISTMSKDLMTILTNNKHYRS